MIHIGTGMVRMRIVRTEEEDAARILAFRKQRREELLAEARENPKPKVAGGMATWFRGRRTIVIV